jgi:hypothetical protein
MRFDLRLSIKKLGSVLALGGMLLSSACIFDTRDANPPSDSGGGCVLDTPQKAFVCMANALSRRQNGDYDRSISENFLFSPTIADSLDQNFQGTCVYDGWDKTVEMDVLNLLISDSDSLHWDYGTPAAKINKNTFVRFEVNYALTVVTAPADTTVYRAVAEIDVRNENGNWRVTFWNETQTVDGSSTWGFLRGILRLQRGVSCGGP